MERFIFKLVILTIMTAGLSARGADPYCVVTTYGYKEGIPASTGSRVIEDPYGYIWTATWNGLYRFDGYEFRPIRSERDNEVRKYSSRFRDIKMGPDGKMWCRIDDNIVLFDVGTYDFTDLHSKLEEKLGEKIKIENAIRATIDGDIVLSMTDGRKLLFDGAKLASGADPLTVISMVSKDTNLKFKSASYHKTPIPPQISKKDIAYSSKDDAGNIWLVTKDGRIMTGSNQDSEFRAIATVETDGSAIKYSCEDRQGQVWMVSNAGIHKIAAGTSPLSYITPPEPSQLRASILDDRNRIWMAWSDSEYVSVSETAEGTKLYLKPDGSLSNSPVRFGHPVYSMTAGPSGEIWLGSKPDGLFRLTSRKDGTNYELEQLIKKGNYYDAAFDKRGHLWLATLGNGIEVIEDPTNISPRIYSLRDRKEYPAEADKVRRIRIIGDSIIVATTTEGLLSFRMPTQPDRDRIDFKLHRSTPGDEQTLGNIATMDAIVGSDGRLYVATESDGLNSTVTPLTGDGKWAFTSIQTGQPALSETTLTAVQLPDGRILAVGKKDINLLDPTGERDIETLGEEYWKKDVVFKEVSPLRMPDGRWLIGLGYGAIAVDLDNDTTPTASYPIEFTSYNIEGGGMTALSPHDNLITLTPEERALNLTFAALSYFDNGTVRYAYRLDDDEEWTSLGTLRTLTFTRLEPGKHKVSVRSTDLTGQWLDNERTITIEVIPKFRETIWAKLLVALTIICILGAGMWAWMHMRSLKRKQRETLEAYLRLLEERTATVSEYPQPHEGKEPEGESIRTGTPEEETNQQQLSEPTIDIPEEDKVLISKVVDFIEKNFSDSGITVDDMAAAAGVSKSSLTKKMKSLMGVTPADFLKTTRLAKSKAMLKETAMPIKEIALDCGFSDMNYFGKCFKAAYGVSPSIYRKEI